MNHIYTSYCEDNLGMAIITAEVKVLLLFIPPTFTPHHPHSSHQGDTLFPSQPSVEQEVFLIRLRPTELSFYFLVSPQRDQY